jgi:hypothetical protein
VFSFNFCTCPKEKGMLYCRLRKYVNKLNIAEEVERNERKGENIRHKKQEKSKSVTSHKSRGQSKTVQERKAAEMAKTEGNKFAEKIEKETIVQQAMVEQKAAISKKKQQTEGET